MPILTRTSSLGCSPFCHSLRGLLCLPFERRETYCFSLIFSSASAEKASASSQRSLSDDNFLVFPDKSIIFGMWVHDHKGVFGIP